MATIVLKYPRIKAVIQLYSNRFILSFSQARRRHTKSYVPYRILTIRNCFSSSFSASPVGASPSWNQPVPVVAPALSPVIVTIVASKGVPPVWVPVGQVFLSLLTAGKKWITTQEKVTYILLLWVVESIMKELGQYCLFHVAYRLLLATLPFSSQRHEKQVLQGQPGRLHEKSLSPTLGDWAESGLWQTVGTRV